MHKIKLLSRVKVEAEDLMIGNSIVGHNQEIDLSSRKLEKASIMRKMVTKEEIVGIEIRNKIKENMKRIIVRKILQLL